MSDSIFEHKKLVFEHVLYEIEMYLFTNILLGQHQTDQLLVNVLWTSNLTYMRNLIGFFSDEPGYDTDITYRTVLNNIDTLGINKKTVAELMKIINKSISHLTKDRISNDYVTHANEYSGAAEPQFRSSVSHQSGTTEPPFRLLGAINCLNFC